MYTGETGIDEKGRVAVSITALFVWLSIKPLTFSIQRGDTQLCAGVGHVHRG